MRFIVEDFGPINKADITIKDFNVFIGPGGSGKSYLAYLIWMFCKMEPKWEVLHTLPTTFEFDRVVKEILENKTISEDNSVKLIDKTMEIFERAIKENIENYIKDTFRVDEVGELVREGEDKAFIRVCNDRGDRYFDVLITKDCGVEVKGLSRSHKYENFLLKYIHDERKIAMYCNKTEELYQSYLPVKDIYDYTDIGMVLSEVCILSLPYMLDEIFDGYFPAMNAYILTDSKSGFLRVARSLLGYALSRRGEIPLSLPDLEMLKNINLGEAKIRDEEIAKIADFIEEEMKGSIVLKTGLMFPEIYFERLKDKHKVPIFRAHSGVRENAPLIMFLRYIIKKGSVVVIEEPETHFHPYMQSLITRAIVLLSNYSKVLITTHSPIVLDELSYLIKLSRLTEEEKEELGYKKEEGISSKSVAVYRFREDGTVDALQVDEEGISEDEFSSVIIELSNKYADIDEFIKIKIRREEKETYEEFNFKN